MLLDELKAAYPGCPDALEWAESEHTAPVWDQARGCGMSPERTMECIRLGIGLLLTYFPAYTESKVVLQQTHSSSFARYVAAKLGAV